MLSVSQGGGIRRSRRSVSCGRPEPAVCPGFRRPGLIIPACAENSHGTADGRGNGPDHPRMRGEQCERDVLKAQAFGSSPHARGTGSDPRRERTAGRIIPACAGNRAGCGSARPAGPDHPRMRGEQRSAALMSVERIGSSPHARGTGRHAPLRGADHRIIPACAGNSARASARLSERSDHPRMRGEQRSIRSRSVAASGSSPHARGTEQLLAQISIHDRIIPACAGNSVDQVGGEAAGVDHPRMRGEQ